MIQWKPTMELRFKNKEVKETDYGPRFAGGYREYTTTRKILQQKWEGIQSNKYGYQKEYVSEWRDVPIAEEE